MINNTLTSPGFPVKYPNYANCVNNVSIPSGKALKLSFSNFSLEPDSDHECW